MDRGAAPLVGIVLLFGMVFVGAALVGVTGMIALDALEGDLGDERTEQTFSTFDHELTTLLHSSSNSAAVTIPDSEDGTYELTDSASASLTVANRFGQSCTVLDDTTLGTLEYESDGQRLAKQAGGTWRHTDDGTVMQSKPDLRYVADDRGTQYLEFSVSDLQGDVGVGEHSMTTTRSETRTADCVSDLGFARYVHLEVTDDTYHDGWYDFVREEFEAVDVGDAAVEDCSLENAGDENVVCHDESTGTVSVLATVDVDRPIDDYLGVEPTIYGGLYVSDETVQFGTHESLVVDSYDGRAGSYAESTTVTDDLFVADVDTLWIQQAEITGFPVVNGDIQIQPEADVSPAALYVGDDLSPASVDVPTARMATAFDGIQPIDDEIARTTTLLENEPKLEEDADGNIDAGAYSVDGDFTREGIEFDTASGDIYVAVDGDVSLEDVTVVGSGQVSIYADGSAIDIESVTVQDDRASQLWVYGTSETDVTVAGTVQGVVYAPGDGSLEVQDGAEIYGAIVSGTFEGIGGSGNADSGSHLEVHFDRSLRTDVPIPEENRTLEFENVMTRNPIDVGFVLDRSGSMGPHTIRERYDHGPWQHPIHTGDVVAGGDLEINRATGGIEELSYGDRTTLSDGDTVRSSQTHPWWGNVSVAVDHQHPGYDPNGLRVDATRSFIGELNASNALDPDYRDRAAVFEFNSTSHRAHGLSTNLETVNDSVENNVGGATNMAAGLEAGVNELEANLRDADSILVLLSDGFNDPSDHDDATLETAEAAADAEITIYTIGLGDGADEELLQTVARTTGGEYRHADNADDLMDIFDGIAEDVIEADTRFEVHADHSAVGGSNDYAIAIDHWNVEISEES
ncbi:vWA domain-containing protein [Natronosalvus halobius]|uniref:vWA domain-containing protein n=1 Tax=Natronosalvus halobius TaxID=2953746 RepID=UPI00209EAC26|nr:vWA domain-containing protein [Natronosalvus halobius]USZ72052.1 VWA domain-containing protein [Natronosalvus halobius]